MNGHQGPVPTGAAMQHPPTRENWEKARRRVGVRLCLWSALFVAALAASVVLTATYGTAGEPGKQAGAFLGALAFLWYPFALYATLGTLGRLKRAGVVLERFGWQWVAAVRKLSGAESTGVPVQLCLPDALEPKMSGSRDSVIRKGGTGVENAGAPSSGVDQGDEPEWSPSLLARSPIRWNRWNDELEQGAWFAGAPHLGGVLALPGGRELVFISRRLEVQRMERSTPKKDHERLVAAARGV